MNPTTVSTVAKLSNDEVLARVKHLARCERELTAVLIAHLAELDARRLYLAEGCASLFTYCTQVLHLSEHAAYGRIAAARASRKFPVILERLSEGSVNLSTVCLLAPHLTPENCREVLEMAQHKTKRQVEELVARLRPQPPVPDVIRRLPVRGPAKIHSAASGTASQAAPTGSSPDRDPLPLMAPDGPAADSAPPPVRPAVVTPLAPQRYKVQFTADAALHEKLRQAQALLRHQIPDGDLSKIFDRALTALLQDLAKRKLAATDRPRVSRRTACSSRHMPAEVRRAVWNRDGGRCAFVADNGHRCTEEAFLEFHHVVPHAAGGPATAENIQLRCRAHNGYEAEREFGRRLLLIAREERASYAHVARNGWNASGGYGSQLGPDRVRTRRRRSGEERREARTTVQDRDL
ncbi:MAG: HNH endonuclease [bacterium]